ncbi:uncharacterized protein [Panulirus ornatus]|uniref:uncharacterized protein isoform X2 n=1 Tax=Panulirus ornatus TaxID=150431 RepID=UPI003A8682ED
MADPDNAMRTHRGLGALLANMGSGNRGGNEDGENKKQPPSKSNFPRQNYQGNSGFDLSSVQGFSGWGDLTSGADTSTKSFNTHSRSDQMDNADKGKWNRRRTTPAGFSRDGPQGQAGGDSRRFRQDHDRDSFGSKDFRNKKKGISGGFRRDGPQGQFDDKRRRPNQNRDDHGPKEVVSVWADPMELNADHNGAWFAQENKRLAEEYGGNFIKVQNIEGQPGKVGYFCEKKNMWEKSQGNSGNSGPPQGFGPAPDNPNIRDAGRPGPPPQGQHLPPSAFGRDDCPGYDRYERRSPGLRNQFDQGGYSRRESSLSDSQPSDDPQYGRRGDSDQNLLDRYGRRSPPPAAPASNPAASGPQENLSGGPTGVLVKRLADCCVKSENDAKLASDVISVLMKSLKEYHQKIGDPNAVLLIHEANIKFNIMKALQNTAQPEPANCEPCQPQNDARPPYNPAGAINYPPQNFNPPTGAPNFPLGNGQMQFNAPPFSYNK